MDDAEGKSRNTGGSKRRKRKRGHGPLPWLLAILLIAVGISGWLCFENYYQKDKIQLAEDHVPTETEEETEAEAVTEAETEPETETEEVVYVPEEKTITISLAGDCSLGKLQTHGYEGSFWQYYDLYGKDYFFQNVKSIFANDSMTLVNFEGVLTESDDRVEKKYNIKGKPEYIDILPSASIECVSFGNNHNWDYGEQGYTDTISLFEQDNITWACNDSYGIYETPEGVTVGYVSSTEFGNEEHEQYVLNGVAALKDQVDLVLVCCHWGIEGDHYPYDVQTNLAHELIDAGADLVVGCHPHVLQGFEYYNGHYIIYSLGNFCFGGNRNPQDKNTMIVQAQFHFTDGELDGEPVLTAIPCRLSGYDSYNDFSPVPAQGDYYTNIISNLNDYSNSYGVWIDENGTLSNR